jgi:hypothetical protein
MQLHPASGQNVPTGRYPASRCLAVALGVSRTSGRFVGRFVPSALPVRFRLAPYLEATSQPIHRFIFQEKPPSACRKAMSQRCRSCPAGCSDPFGKISWTQKFDEPFCSRLRALGFGSLGKSRLLPEAESKSEWPMSVLPRAKFLVRRGSEARRLSGCTECAGCGVSPGGAPARSQPCLHGESSTGRKGSAP